MRHVCVCTSAAYFSVCLLCTFECVCISCICGLVVRMSVDKESTHIASLSVCVCAVEGSKQFRWNYFVAKKPICIIYMLINYLRFFFLVCPFTVRIAQIDSDRNLFIAHGF